MGRLSSDPLDPEVLLQVEGEMFNILSRREVGELEGILRGILTPPEVEMLAKRLALVKELAKNGTQAQISSKLKLSTTTISQMRSRLRYDKNLRKLSQEISSKI